MLQICRVITYISSFSSPESRDTFTNLLSNEVIYRITLYGSRSLGINAGYTTYIIFSTDAEDATILKSK